MNSWLSPAKLNLFLYINYQQDDGYHHLQTLFQLIDLCDELTFENRSDNQINLITQSKNLATTDNLIIKAANQLLEYAQSQGQAPVNYGVDIHLSKHIPIGAGLGGGSSNAATTLMALNVLWNLNYSPNVLMKLGKSLGADVPIFILGKNAFAEGIGEQLTEVFLPERYFLVIKPDVSISTKAIFTDPNLTRNTPKKSLNELMTQPFKNDCQNTVLKLYPIINEYITFLSQFNETRLTGTGSAIFAVASNKEEATKLLAKFQSQFHNHQFEYFVVKSLNP